MKRTASRIVHTFHTWLTSVIEPDEGTLRDVPDHILSLTVFLCLSVLLQGVADVVLKVISYTPVLTALPWRTDFLFLTAISVLMGYRTLQGMRMREFDVTRNSIELGVLVEISLVVGDTQFILQHLKDIPEVIPMRLPFIILTIINIFILLYSYRTLKLRKWL
jgi:hypothetical protein